jgi:hypothetical protein
MYPIASSIITSAGVYAADFSSIPQTFAHLQLRIYARGTQASVNNFILLQYNGDTGGFNYRAHSLVGDGATAGASGDAAQSTYINIGNVTGATATANVFGVGIVDILDYTSTTKNKTNRTLIGWDNNGSGQAFLSSGLWSISPIVAINRIQLYMANAAVGTRIDLYGISTSNATGA